MTSLMPPPIEAVLGDWSFPLPLAIIFSLTALLYLRGWLSLGSRSANTIPPWRAGSFFLGLFLTWVAVGSPLAAFDEQLLTIHMMQHLLLMTIAPPLILLGAPLIPFLHGLPRKFVQIVLGPLLRWPPMQQVGDIFTQPVFCWLAAAAALAVWHIPAAFTLGLQSEVWHAFEHASFLLAGLLFWWPVIQPWPSVVKQPRWSILLYLFLATLPCDVLSAFLIFCDRVVYPIYLTTYRQFSISALQDQECAGALMWTCVTIVYLVASAILTTRLLASPSAYQEHLAQSQPPGVMARTDASDVEAA
jgi:cytochrome c oxidase assembly factor CtaG